jgi:hypothetical protein
MVVIFSCLLEFIPLGNLLANRINKAARARLGHVSPPLPLALNETAKFFQI